MKYLILSLTLLSAAGLFGETAVTPVENQETENFLQDLRSEIKKQDDLVNKIKDQVARRDVVNDSSIVNQFESAYTMLNVKKTLYANFVGTPSINSPLIRAKLLQIFKKDLITPGDLSELDALVKQERPKYVKPAGQ